MGYGEFLQDVAATFWGCVLFAFVAWVFIQGIRDEQRGEQPFESLPWIVNVSFLVVLLSMLGITVSIGL